MASFGELQPLAGAEAACGPNPTRHRGAVLAVLGLATIAAAFVASRAQSPPMSASVLHAATPSSDESTETSAMSLNTSAPTRHIVDMADFLRFPKVVEWLEKHNVPAPAPEDLTTAERGRLQAWLPSKFEIDVNPAAMSGSLGAQAGGGHLTFNVYQTLNASWTIVMKLDGELEQVAPARSVEAEQMVHWCAMKNYDEDTLLLISSENHTAKGHAFRWNWRNDEYERLGGNNLFGCHDIQWASTGDDAFWAPAAEVCDYNGNVSLFDAHTGTVLRTLADGFGTCVADVNHAQLLENDTHALLSLRAIDAIGKYRLSADAPDGVGERQWIIGGAHGTWPIVDLERNVTYPPGATVWSGQHNAEYMGEGDSGHEVWMFDDLGLGNESRLLIVVVDEPKREARLEWEYRLGALSRVFGDCDPLPSGNIYGSYWRNRYSDGALGDQAQSGIIEVTRDTSTVAWHLQVYGRACAQGHNGTCEQDIDTDGWKMYSVERFFDTPVLPGVDAVSALHEAHSGRIMPPSCANGWLKFTVFNSYKESTAKPGAFELRVRDADATPVSTVASGTFLFKPHWRPTVVSAPVHFQGNNFSQGASGHSVELIVRNVRMVEARFNLTCTGNSA